MTPRSRSEQ